MPCYWRGTCKGFITRTKKLIEGGVELNGDTPSVNKTTRELYFDVVDVLCKRFTGLSPLEVYKAELAEVYDLYVDCIIHDSKEKKASGNEQGDVWVTSQTAGWH